MSLGTGSVIEAETCLSKLEPADFNSLGSEFSLAHLDEVTGRFRKNDALRQGAQRLADAFSRCNTSLHPGRAVSALPVLSHSSLGPKDMNP